jgi:hypothetical protein
MGVTPIYALPWPEPTDPADGPGGFRALAVAAEAALVGGGPAYVTALPASPVDGQEVYFGADPAAGVIWHLRYRAAATGAYKWEFVGGSDMRNVQPATGLATSSVIYVAGGPKLTVPLAGQYQVRWAFNGAHAATGGLGLMAVKNGAAPAVDVNAARGQAPGAGYDLGGAGDQVITVTAAGTVLDCWYRTGGGGAFSVNTYGTLPPWIAARPVRVG